MKSQTRHGTPCLGNAHLTGLCCLGNLHQLGRTGGGGEEREERGGEGGEGEREGGRGIYRQRGREKETERGKGLNIVARQQEISSFTLFARSTAGIGFPLGRRTLLSRSAFHIWTASKVDSLVTSNTTKAPTASL